MHIRYARAAVAAESAPFSCPPSALRTSGPRAGGSAPRILWSSPGMSTPAGRLIGVRLRDGSIDVALVERGSDQMRWVVAAHVLTDYQVALWIRTSKFSPS